ncbi:MAG: hypothetical protein M1825_001752 [Sarcosagium campestre]|nr:MAG: hypothetical protein M1825_001752 [Sarcosagium campestre]
MTWLQHLSRLYSLDTLDHRFTTENADTPPSKDQTNKEGRNLSRTEKAPSPSRWRTPEFSLYCVVFVVMVPLMFKMALDVSKESHPNYPNFSRLLSPGWIAGRKVDNSDAQYSGFRNNLPYMFIVLTVHPLLRRLYTQLRSSNHKPNHDALIAADIRVEQRVSFDVWFAAFFVCALHGLSAFKILFILYINYSIATRIPRQHIPIATWTFNIFILFANELLRGYPYAEIVGLFLPTPVKVDDGSLPPENWGSWLDGYRGLIPRWEILFKVTVLRLISFNMDYYWSLAMSGGSPIEKKQLDPANLSERDRIACPAKPRDYSFRIYLAYCLYSPLYLAGPILTFNEYLSQLRYPLSSLTNRRIFLYGVRFLVTLLAMEVLLHFIYAVAISKASPPWETYTPFQLSMLGYFNLHIIWLKLLLPWRFFRLWALIDGVDPPENMVRCMSNNYSAVAFWRGWHRSFNRWTIRYIYIPLGGSGGVGGNKWLNRARAVRNFLAVFTYVAMWHDINLRLLMWGWMVTLFILPEMLAAYLFPERNWQDRKETYRVLCGIGAVGNILMMMTANLIGFAVGIDGVRGLIHGIVGTYSGLVFLAMACATLFVAAQVMFELRENEIRDGIQMKC